MKKRKQIAFNRFFIFMFIISLLFGYISVAGFAAKDVGGGILFCFVALIFITLSIFSPCYYVFDSEGVSICYVFLPCERYLWKNIYAIDVQFKSYGHRPSIFFRVFCISGSNEGKLRFYMNGIIVKSIRTKRLLEKYWDGQIQGYLIDSIKAWFRKRKQKAEAEIAAHLTDEIVPLERETRAEAREWLAPYVAQAKQNDIYIKSKYCYVTKDFEESNSRPDEGYTYKLILEIAHDGETDEDRITVVNVDLLYVRLGKTSYRGVKNKFAEEEIELTISKAFEELDEM
jgi:hypothetical protein